MVVPRGKSGSRMTGLTVRTYLGHTKIGNVTGERKGVLFCTPFSPLFLSLDIVFVDTTPSCVFLDFARRL